jgi:hypothetical protein
VFGSYLLPFVLQIVHVIFMLIVFIFANSCLTRYPFQMKLMSFNSNTTSTTGRARNNNPSRAHPQLFCVCFVFCFYVNNICNRNCFPFQNTSGCFRSYRSLGFCVVIVGHCMSFLLWSMYCLSFDSCLQIAPLVSSNCLC